MYIIQCYIRKIVQLSFLSEKILKRNETFTK